MTMPMALRKPARSSAISSGNRGSALVELALTFPLMLILLAGVLDYGRALTKATAIANAARIGAQYGSSSASKTTDAAGIQAAAINSAPSFSGLTVTSAQICQCSGGSSVSCGGTCGASKMLMYVQVTVSGTSSAVFSYSGLPFAGNISATATMRAR
jgi:Flp pilus assembly protein TadG